MTYTTTNLHHGKWHEIVNEILSSIIDSQSDDVANDRRAIVKLDDTANLLFYEYSGKMWWEIIATTGESIDIGELYDVQHAIELYTQIKD
jgi:hypothetical protein